MIEFSFERWKRNKCQVAKNNSPEDRRQRRNDDKQTGPEAHGTPMRLYQIVANLTSYGGRVEKDPKLCRKQQ